METKNTQSTPVVTKSEWKTALKIVFISLACVIGFFILIGSLASSSSKPEEKVKILTVEEQKHISDSINKGWTTEYLSFKVGKYSTIESLNIDLQKWIFIEAYNTTNKPNWKNFKNKNNIVYSQFRYQWYTILKKVMWENNFEFKLDGNNDILTVIHFSLVDNSLKQKTLDTLNKKLKELHFKRIQMMWYEGSEYTYWDLNY